MWIGPSLVSDYKNFAEDAFDMSISLAWLENMYRDDINGTIQQCPVAYGVGSDRDDSWNRLLSEQYDNILNDPPNKNYVSVLYICNCDPDCEDLCGIHSGLKQKVKLQKKEAVKLSYDYLKLINKSLPKFDKRILKVPKQKDYWLEKIGFEQILKAMNDDLELKNIKNTNYQEVHEQGRVIKLDRSKGYLRYIHQGRQYQHEKFPKTAIDSLRASQIVKEVVTKLSMVDITLRFLRMRGICASGAENKPRFTRDQFTVELFATVERRINDYPVLNSSAQFSISNNGEISRARIKWPQFNMRNNLEFKSREYLVNEILSQLETIANGKPISLRIELAYIPQEDEKISFIPGLVVAVNDNISPVVFTVNIAK